MRPCTVCTYIHNTLIALRLDTKFDVRRWPVLSSSHSLWFLGAECLPEKIIVFLRKVEDVVLAVHFGSAVHQLDVQHIYLERLMSVTHTS